MLKVILLYVCIIFLVTSSDADYDNQDHWKGACNVGKSQSPVDINYLYQLPRSSVTFNISIPNKKYKTNPHGPALQNDWDGSTVTLGGSLNLQYKSLQYHFHTKAEHTFHGQRTDLELHIVHKLVDGYKHKLTHLVVGFLFRVLPPYARRHKTVFDQVDFTGPSFINFSQVFLPWINNKNIFNYDGSLTTPKCDEIVNWFVVEQIHWISAKQLQLFQILINEGKPNYRKIQPLNSRKISVIVAKRGRY